MKKNISVSPAGWGIAFATAALVFSPAAAIADGVTLSIFSQNRALVRETRQVEPDKTAHFFEVAGLPSQTDPTSIRITIPSMPGALREQSFLYDGASRERILRHYIGQPVEIVRYHDGTRESLRGILRSADGMLVLESDGRLILDPAGEIVLPPSVPRPAIAPLVRCTLSKKAPENLPVELAYITGGISWSAEYAAVLSSDERSLAWSGTARIENNAGVRYADARVWLVAGDVNAAPAANDAFNFRAMGKAQYAMAAPEAQAAEQAFFEYHRYRIPSTVTLAAGESKEVPLVRGSNLAAAKRFVYDGAVQFRSGRVSYQPWSRNDRNYGTPSDAAVQVVLELKNSSGAPLPAGRVRVYKEDAETGPELVGEDRIGHTPVNGDIRIDLGNAFDLTGERVQTEFKAGNDWCEESFRITVRNAKSEAAPVRVREHLYRWSNWKLTAQSVKPEKKDAKTLDFTLDVPAGGERSLTYTVRYWW